MNQQPACIVPGDAYDLLDTLDDESIDLVLTSPPYWGLRTYGLDHNWGIWEEWIADHGKEEVPSYEWYREHGGVLGLEPTPDWYVANLTAIFHKVQRTLKKSGSVWLNVGDTYFARWSSIRDKGRQGLGDDERVRRRTPMGRYRQEKQLLLVPSRVAIAMQEDRWILRNDVIWYKPNVPPRNEKDRLPLTHEHFFHFVQRRTDRRPTYYYDLSEVIDGGHDVITQNVLSGSNGHSATFPRELIRSRVRSSCPPDGLVLDPFSGTGTTLAVAVENGRRALGFELADKYVEATRETLAATQPTLL
jgi:DNA modification methylase